jgi:hypothetical protein
MKPENQRPNPVEDYMRGIMSGPEKLEDNKIKIGGNTSQAGTLKGPKKSPITEQAFKQRKHVFDPTGRVEQITPDETKVADVRRHPFGLVMIYAQFVLAIGLSVGIIAVLLPSVLGDDNNGSNLFIGVLILFMSVFAVVFLILATRIYRGNQLIITDLNVTEVQQLGLFNRKVSELSLANVEDVTANTHGIFPTMFNFGTLTIETAGEQHNFTFKYCPNPSAYAKALQDVRSEYLQQHTGHYGAHRH